MQKNKRLTVQKLQRRIKALESIILDLSNEFDRIDIWYRVYQSRNDNK